VALERVAQDLKDLRVTMVQPVPLDLRDVMDPQDHLVWAEQERVAQDLKDPQVTMVQPELPVRRVMMVWLDP
jgi:hypothetical protein